MNRGPQWWFYVAATALVSLVFFLLLFANVDFDDDNDIGRPAPVGAPFSTA